ncbi:MAG: hypothetical protein CVU84_13165 [Firmicutes bacterium HGW-Firmicutes-1]|jgi:tetratricopeptide (TPR) repeat protein|nr:MAG: hypothetical protein CVU84_13165 [Firmicutes bacterium HGW-Firmicutes-1]
MALGQKVVKELNTEIGFIEDLLKDYEEQSFLQCIHKIEAHFESCPNTISKKLIRNIYLNCCMKAAISAKAAGDFSTSKEIYDKLLTYESELIFESDVILYNVYSQLAEVVSQLDADEDLNIYDEKAKLIVNKMVSSRVIQSIYISFIEGNYDEVIKRIRVLNVDDLDQFNKGRYYMMIGSAYYYKEHYKEAIGYLENSIIYYKDKPNNSVLELIFEELSKCYMHLEKYKEGFKYLKLAHNKINI